MNKFKCIAVACSLALVLSATGCGKSNSNNTNTVEMVSTATNADGGYASIAGTWEDDNLNKIVIRSDGKFLTYNGNNEVTEEGICVYDESDKKIINFAYPDGEKLYTIETDGTENINSFKSNKTGKTFNKTASADYSLELPAYTYTGSDKIMKAITEYCLKEGADYTLADVFIPAPVIFKTDESDSNDIKVTGIFWVLGYDIYADTLYGCSGTELAGIIHLKQNGSDYEVVSADFARDGADYDADIQEYCNGDQELLDKFANSQEDFEASRKAEIKSYVDTNGLNITKYQDFGWTPVELN